MDRWPDNRAWFLLLPALCLLALVGGLPLLAVVNYGLHDIFTLDQLHWVGLQWFEDILHSDRFWASLGSRLIDLQSQNRTVAAKATAERKTFGHLS